MLDITLRTPIKLSTFSPTTSVLFRQRLCESEIAHFDDETLPLSERHFFMAHDPSTSAGSKTVSFDNAQKLDSH